MPNSFYFILICLKEFDIFNLMDKLKPAHLIFVNEIAKGKNQTQAYQKAFPNAAYSTARINASKMLTKTNIRNAVHRRISRANAHAQVEAAEVLGSAAFQMRSGMRDVLNKNGSYSFKKACKTGAIDLVKKHKETIKTVIDARTGDKEITKTIEIELLTNESARKEVAGYIGLGFNAQTQNATNQILDFALSLIKNHAFAKSTALEAVQQEFPEADLEELERIIDGELLETIEVPAESEAE